jgi:hypothetical protein
MPLPSGLKNKPSNQLVRKKLQADVLAGSFAYFLTLKMDAVRSCETSVNSYQMV